MLFTSIVNIINIHYLSFKSIFLVLRALYEKILFQIKETENRIASFSFIFQNLTILNFQSSFLL